MAHTDHDAPEEENSQQDNDDSLAGIALSNLTEILSNNDFAEVESQLNKEIAEIDQLYQRTSKHTMALMDAQEGNEPSTPRRMGTAEPKKVSPMYISTQITNLISMKNLKLSLLKHGKDLKESRLDRAFKIVNQIQKDKANGSGAGGIPAAEILKFLLQSNVRLPSIGGNIQRDAGETEEESEEKMLARLEAAEKDEATKEPVNNTLLDHRKTPQPIVEEPKIEEELETPEVEDDGEILFYAEGDQQYYIVDKQYNVIREVTSEEVDVVEESEGVYYCNNFHKYVEIGE